MPKDKKLGLKRTAKEWEISLAEHIGKAVDKTPDVVMALLSSHPIVMALAIMGASTVGIAAFDSFDPDGKTKGHLEGLYNGAQTVGLAAATVPVVAGGLNLLGSFIQARKTGEGT